VWRVVPRAKELGVAIALETHDGLSSARVAAEVLRRIAAPQVHALWDVLHPTRMGESPAEVWDLIGPRVRHVHFKDAARDGGGRWRAKPIGEGEVPLRECLRRLHAAGLVRSGPAAGDRRVRRAEWTATGRREARALDRASDALARGVLEPLPPAPRARLVAAMAEVTRLLRAGAVTVAVEPPGPEAEACVAAYFTELAGRDARFDVGRIRKLALDRLHPPHGALVMARLDGVPVGCGAVSVTNGAAEIKRVWVHPGARGLGVGRRMLALLEASAVALGARVARLDTNRTLTEARALYLSAGYHEVPAFNDEMFADHWFEKALPTGAG
ncbi:MAG: GNAT family N-acetyltransferase, partial [Acetobacteraceae bacterium]